MPWLQNYTVLKHVQDREGLEVRQVCEKGPTGKEEDGAGYSSLHML